MRSTFYAISSAIIAASLIGCNSSGGSGIASNAAIPAAPESSVRVPAATVASVAAPSLTAARTLTIPLMSGMQSAIAFTTFPGATCSLGSPSWTFHADINGDVKIFATPKSASVANDLIVCTMAKQEDRLKLVFSHGQTAQSVPIGGRTPIKHEAPDEATMAAFAAQNGFDPRTASDAVLEAHDLPPRPGTANSDPADNVGWLRAVFSPNKSVIRAGVPIPGVFAGPYKRSAQMPPSFTPDYGGGITPDSSSNYSGYGANGVQGTWNTVRGYWDDPNSYEMAETPGYQAMWVGIDGLGLGGSDDTTVYQDGTETDRFTKPDVQYTDTFIWYEAYPNPVEYWHATTPGDEEYCTVYKVVGQSVNANYYCKDITEDQVNQTTLNVGAGFVGDSVEWIIERPDVTGIGTYYFTDYGTAAMTEAETISGNTTIYYNNISTVSGYNLYDITLNGANNDVESSTSDPGGNGNIDWTWHNIQ